MIERLSPKVIGQDAMNHERIFFELYSATRPAAGGVVAEGLGAIENALLDAKAKALGVPCYALLGGKVRDKVWVYWSHCATWRINHPHLFKPAITDLDGVQEIGRRGQGTRFYRHEDQHLPCTMPRPLHGWRPGFGVPFYPELNVEKAGSVRNFCVTHLEAIRAGGAGPDVDLLLDLNFNAKTEGRRRSSGRSPEFDMFWVEDRQLQRRGARLYPAAFTVRTRSSSCTKTLLGVREFLPFFRAQSMDVAIIDAVWNGVWQSMKIAAAA